MIRTNLQKNIVYSESPVIDNSLIGAFLKKPLDIFIAIASSHLFSSSNKNQPKTIYQFKTSSQGWRRISSVTDELGNTDNKTYHNNGQLRSKRAQNDSSDFYTYNDDDQLITKIVAKNTEVVKRFDYEYLNIKK